MDSRMCNWVSHRTASECWEIHVETNAGGTIFYLVCVLRAGRGHSSMISVMGRFFLFYHLPWVPAKIYGQRSLAA